MLCVPWVINDPSSALETSPADVDARIQEQYVAVDAVLELRFDRTVLGTAGVALDAGVSSQPGRPTLVYDLVPPGGTFRAVFFNGVLGSLPGGDLMMRGAPLSVRAAYRKPLWIESLRVVHEPMAGGAYEFGVYIDAPWSLRLFDLSGANFDFDNDSETMLIEADVRMAMDLADALGTPELSGRIIGRVDLTMRMRLTETVVTRADGAIVSAVLHPNGDGPPAPPVGEFASGDTPTEGPDVIVGDLPTTQQFGRTGSIGSGTVGLAVGTTSCNKGNVELNWFALPNTDHPVIPYNLYRLKTVDGSERFEQLGHSWMKHGFFALQQNACGFGCMRAADGTHLGVGCSDPYSAGLNASQCGLGPRAAVNPYTGVFEGGGNLGGGNPCSSNYPSMDHRGHAHNGISHRLQVRDVDLMPDLNPGAAYFSEAQYVTPHEFDAQNGNQNNNISYRRVDVTGPSGSGVFSFTNIGSTVREQPAINAWSEATRRTIEPDFLTDGRAILATQVTDLGGGMFHYEYAIYNMHLNRSIRSFSVPLSTNITIENVGFHAPLNHEPEANTPTFSNSPWDVEITSSAITWSTQTFAQNPNANAIRFGTLYNFRFDTSGPARNDIVTLGLFNPGGDFQTDAQVPAEPEGCNEQGDCDDGLFCNGDELCDDGVCQAGDPPCADPPQECDEDKNACMLNGDPLRGGQLYDNWMAAMGIQGPEEDHPLWQFRPDQTSNNRTGADTWRCKECHGWDRKGVEGQYATGPHRTGFPGIVGTTLLASQLVTLLTEPPGGDVTNGHSYGTVLSTSDIEDVTAFVLADGAFDDDAYIDPSTGVFVGDPVQGELNYQFGGLIACGTCHGTDGTAINFGSPSSPEWVGTHAVEHPWEVMHKVRYGNPGTPMPSWIAAGGDLQGIADLGRYVQDTFPFDCLNESHCTGDTICFTDTCLDGRCTLTERLYGDVAGEEGSCGSNGTVDLADILAVLNGFQAIFAEGCGFDDINIAGDAGSCTPNDTIDLIDILAVLNAFQGDDPCCTAAKTQRRSGLSRSHRYPG